MKTFYLTTCADGCCLYFWNSKKSRNESEMVFGVGNIIKDFKALDKRTPFRLVKTKKKVKSGFHLTFCWDKPDRVFQSPNIKVRANRTSSIWIELCVRGFKHVTGIKDFGPGFNGFYRLQQVKE